MLGLHGLNIPATALTSLTPKEDVSSIYQQLVPGSGLKLIYCTPEKVVKSKRFMSKLEKLYQVRTGAAILLSQRTHLLAVD